MLDEFHVGSRDVGRLGSAPSASTDRSPSVYLVVISADVRRPRFKAPAVVAHVVLRLAARSSKNGLVTSVVRIRRPRQCHVCIVVGSVVENAMSR